jgi:hypothetical protein
MTYILGQRGSIASIIKRQLYKKNNQQKFYTMVRKPPELDKCTAKVVEERDTCKRPHHTRLKRPQKPFVVNKGNYGPPKEYRPEY